MGLGSRSLPPTPATTFIRRDLTIAETLTLISVGRKVVMQRETTASFKTKPLSLSTYTVAVN
jgi:hypothetical protein